MLLLLPELISTQIFPTRIMLALMVVAVASILALLVSVMIFWRMQVIAGPIQDADETLDIVPTEPSAQDGRSADE